MASFSENMAAKIINEIQGSLAELESGVEIRQKVQSASEVNITLTAMPTIF
jgi:hypothetical protein